MFEYKGRSKRQQKTQRKAVLWKEQQQQQKENNLFLHNCSLSTPQKNTNTAKHKVSNSGTQRKVKGAVAKPKEGRPHGLLPSTFNQMVLKRPRRRERCHYSLAGRWGVAS